ncbi:MAG TPA: cell envelope integrity protein TolA [Crenotrichaceae bacterium]|nr:cell envelope integrity protein TolA [Crenotrichaceae bacterium]
MIKTLHKYFIPICLALLVHIVLFSLFFINFKSDSKPLKPAPQPEIIQATSVDEKKVIQEVKKLQQHETDKRLAEQKRQRVLEEKRVAEQQKIKQLRAQQEKQAKRIEQARQEQQKLALAKQAEEKKLEQIRLKQAQEKKRLKEIADKKKAMEDKRKKEQARLAALEKKRKLELKRQELERKKREKAAKLAAKKKAERAAKRKAEAVARKKLEAEQAAAEAVRQGKIISNATRIIMRKVERSWIRPPGTQDGLSATIRVNVKPGGTVTNATVIKSSGNPGFDRSAELAVRKASPLPVPSDPGIFKQFQSFTFNFSPS